MSIDLLLEWCFRFTFYVCFGFTLEIVYAVIGIERSVGAPIPRRVPKKYLEGFVSLYMIPIHGFGMLFGFEATAQLMADWAWPLRYLVWAVSITGMEAIGGFIYHKLTGFYSWDYYRLSPYKIFKEGYTTWTLLPQWGLAGMMMEVYSGLLIKLSPTAVQYLKTYFSF